MKFIKTLIIGAMALILSSSVSIAGLEDMTEAEREAFGAAVREYLLTNPEVIFEAVDAMEQRQVEQQREFDLALVQKYKEQLNNDGVSYVGGNPEGDIIIVEFLDYRCAYCKRAHTEVVSLLKNNDDIRLIVKELPILGDESIFASRAAISILLNQSGDLYHDFGDALMKHNGPVNMQTLSRLASDVGADSDLMALHMNDPEVDQMIIANQTLAQAMQISGTPTFVIGKEMLRGYLPLAGMQEYVDQARGE